MLFKQFDSTIARIPLVRNGKPVRKTYCAFWRKDNFRYYIEDYSEILNSNSIISTLPSP